MNVGKVRKELTLLKDDIIQVGVECQLRLANHQTIKSRPELCNITETTERLFFSTCLQLAILENQ